MGGLSVPPAALAVLGALEAAGAEAWLVGGFVRDGLLGRAASDADIAASTPWPETARILRGAGFSVRETGTKHGTVTAVSLGEGVEVTTYRSDGAYSDGRHPDEVRFVGSVEEDLARRDFTMNAIAYHPRRGFCDPYGGRDDLASGTIRAVGEPERRFSEDGLRILRACRFVAELGFSVDGRTARAMAACKSMTLQLAAERVTSELNRLLTGPFAGRALLEGVDALAAVLPELAACKGFDQRNPHHLYDVLEHTARVVDGVRPELPNRWAALLHDLGKPAAFFADGRGVGHFYGHEVVGERLGRAVLGRLCFSQRFVDEVCLLVRDHDRAVAPTRKAVRRRLADAGGREDVLRTLLDIQRADGLAQNPACGGAEKARVAQEAMRVLDEVVEQQAAFDVGHLAVGGGDVLALGVPAGPEVGRMLRAALDEVMEERLPNTREALLGFLGDYGKDAR